MVPVPSMWRTLDLTQFGSTAGHHSSSESISIFDMSTGRLLLAEGSKETMSKPGDHQLLAGGSLCEADTIFLFLNQRGYSVLGSNLYMTSVPILLREFFHPPLEHFVCTLLAICFASGFVTKNFDREEQPNRFDVALLSVQLRPCSFSLVVLLLACLFAFQFHTYQTSPILPAVHWKGKCLSRLYQSTRVC